MALVGLPVAQVVVVQETTPLVARQLQAKAMPVVLEEHQITMVVEAEVEPELLEEMQGLHLLDQVVQEYLLTHHGV
jgi:hypothetical protein